MTNTVTSGVVAFSNVTEHEMYKGQTTGRYSVVINMDAAEGAKLSDMGVKLREYEGKAQRAFRSKFKVDVVDLQGEPVSGEIPYGSKVRLLWADGPADPSHGVPTYLNKIRVVEFAENGGDGDTPEEF
jgi:hypothetical protein